MQRLSRDPRKTGVECVGDRLRLRPWVGVEAFNAHHTRVREPELRASTAQQGFIVEKQTGEGPKPCGSDPSSCRISAVISPRERYDDRRVHQLRSALGDGSAMRQP